jgi:hypothetical protein
MAVQNKQPAAAEASINAKSMADKSVDKEEKSTEKPVETEAEETENQPVTAPDVITETVEIAESPAQSSARTDPLNDFKEKVEEELNMPDRPQKNFMWPILFIFIIAVVLLAGVFAYKQGVFKAIKINAVPSSPTPTVSPTPTKTVDLTKYEIEILNGSSVDGEASKQKAALEAAGFTISSVGNADNSDYADTVIKAKKEVDSGFITKLKSVLSGTFTVGDTQSLDESSSVPVVVILGAKK